MRFQGQLVSADVDVVDATRARCLARSGRQEQHLPEQGSERRGLSQLRKGLAEQWKELVHLRHVRFQPLVYLARGKLRRSRGRMAEVMIEWSLIRRSRTSAALPARCPASRCALTRRTRTSPRSWPGARPAAFSRERRPISPGRTRPSAAPLPRRIFARTSTTPGESTLSDSIGLYPSKL